MWADSCQGLDLGESAATWLSECLGREKGSVRLIYGDQKMQKRVLADSALGTKYHKQAPSKYKAGTFHSQDFFVNKRCEIECFHAIEQHTITNVFPLA